MSEFARLLFVGDISLGGGYLERNGVGAPRCTTAFSEVRRVFQGADLRIGNLECPLVKGSSPRKKKNLLWAPPESVAALSYLDFTVLNLANNHITDQGAEGIAATRAALEARGIACFGAGPDLETAAAPAFGSAASLTFAFLGFADTGHDVNAEVAATSSEGCVPFSMELVEREIEAARAKASHVVVSLHWGYQYDRYPQPEQVAVARRIIDMGALIVYGHHPHVVQGFERYRHGAIFYSLGNFFFPDFSRTDGARYRFPNDARWTVAVVCDVDAAGVRSVSTVPLALDRHSRLRVIEGLAAARARRSVARFSRALQVPDYASLWRSRHARTERRRRRQESSLRVRADVVGVWQRARARGVAGSLKLVTGGRVVEMLRLACGWARGILG